MSLALVVAALAVVLFFVLRARRKKASAHATLDSTPAIDAWVTDTLELELAERALGTKASTPEERKGIARSLRGEPDPEVVSKIEDLVKAVELEYVRYAHESDAEIALRVRYEDGQTTTTTKRTPWTEVPASVREDFERRGSTRVFRTWPMPWSRARAL